MNLQTAILGFFIPAVVSILVFFASTTILGLSTLVGAVFGGFAMFWGFKIASEYALKDQRSEEKSSMKVKNDTHKQLLKEVGELRSKTGRGKSRVPRTSSRVRKGTKNRVVGRRKR